MRALVVDDDVKISSFVALALHRPARLEFGGPADSRVLLQLVVQFGDAADEIGIAQQRGMQGKLSLELGMLVEEPVEISSLREGHRGRGLTDELAVDKPARPGGKFGREPGVPGEVSGERPDGSSGTRGRGRGRDCRANAPRRRDASRGILQTRRFPPAPPERGWPRRPQAEGWPADAPGRGRAARQSRGSP